MSSIVAEDQNRPLLGETKETKATKYSQRYLYAGFILVFLIVGVSFLFIPWLPNESLNQAITLNKTPKHIRPIGLKDKSGPETPEKNLNLIDPDTPKDKRSITSYKNKEKWVLQFSDEFNEEGRTFRSGDDPAWEAVDLWDQVTGDEEHYDPDYVTTQDGKLVITIDDKRVGDLKYTSGMLQSWNKVCFTGGRLEISVSLPGNSVEPGLWPRAWILGNLARAGYRSTTDGVWSYSYDTCDSGVTKNQSITNGQSWLVGQKLNKCVCPGEDHPSPGKGRGAPEIDLMEASANRRGGTVSQSLMMAPFDHNFRVQENLTKIYNYQTTVMNTYRGGPLQQAVSALSKIPDDIYGGAEYVTFAVEYEPGSDGYITWFIDDEVIWTVTAGSIGPNKVSKVGQRLIPEEPMSIILNLAISPQFSRLSQDLSFPNFFLVDYVRLYQHVDRKSVECDPTDYPTAKYIKTHSKAYYNKDFDSWESAGYTKPNYSLTDKC